jgi:hypothetical protein
MDFLTAQRNLQGAGVDESLEGWPPEKWKKMSGYSYS